MRATRLQPIRKYIGDCLIFHSNLVVVRFKFLVLIAIYICLFLWKKFCAVEPPAFRKDLNLFAPHHSSTTCFCRRHTKISDERVIDIFILTGNFIYSVYFKRTLKVDFVGKLLSFVYTNELLFVFRTNTNLIPSRWNMQVVWTILLRICLSFRTITIP